nr:immunoglobulin light chain junction region [Macaca mulatta]
CQQGYSPPCSF